MAGDSLICQRCKRRPKKKHWNAKHAHIREAAMTYFLNHTWEETRDRFGLTQSELKSLFTAGYQMPELRHLRKDTRRHDEWSLGETLFLLQHAGLRDRVWISKRLNRGGVHAIKEHVRRLNGQGGKRGIWTKHLHGLTQTQVHAFGLPLTGIRTQAGPGFGQEYSYRLVPWVTLCEYLKSHPGRARKVPFELRSTARAMARFQMWIYGVNSSIAARRKIQKAIRGTLWVATSRRKGKSLRFRSPAKSTSHSIRETS